VDIENGRGRVSALSVAGKTNCDWSKRSRRWKDKLVLCTF